MRNTLFNKIIGTALLCCVGLTAQATHADELTVRFEKADDQLSSSKIFNVNEIAQRTTVQFPRGSVRDSVVDVISSRYYKYDSPMDNIDFLFPSSSEIFDEFDETFITPLNTALQEVKTTIETTKIDSVSSQTVEAMSLNFKPMRFSLGVTNNKVMVEIDGLEVYARVRARLSNDLYKILCGSTATIQVRSSVVAKGEMDINSGIFNLTELSAHENSSTECSGLLGKALDVFIELIIDNELEDSVDEFIAPVLAEFSGKQVGKSLQNLIGEEIIIAGQILGIDVIQEATDAIDKYAGGINFDFLVGLNYFGSGKHLLGFSAYQDLINTRIYREGGGYSAIKTYAEFTCPSWASKMKVYESSAVRTGSRPGRGSLPVYGYKFNLAYEGAPSKYSKLMELRQRGRVESNVPLAIMATCESKNGFWSRLRPVVYLPDYYK